MTHHPAPSDFEERTNATYEALMWALSRPGKPRTLPDSGQSGIIATLIDRECAVYADDEALAQIAAQTGAHLVAPEAADHLFLSSAPDPSLLSTIRQGSDMYPEDGATLIITASLASGSRLRLTGPGVDGHVDVSVGGVPPALWHLRKQIMRYPMGFEVFLIDGDQVIGLPRTTEIEVL